MKCFFVSDLHGHTDRYDKLIDRIKQDVPEIVFFGGDLLPHGMHRNLYDDFTRGFLFSRFDELRKYMGNDYPKVS